MDSIFEKLVDKAFELLLGRFIDAKKAKEEHRALVQQVQAACDTRAVYTTLHGQVSLTAMFAALAATRRKLQELKAQFTDADQQQPLADIIGELDSIERERVLLPLNAQQLPQADSEVADRIHAMKVRIITSIQALSEAVGLPYKLPSRVTPIYVCLELEEAVAPTAHE